jgi:phage shock protein A
MEEVLNRKKAELARKLALRQQTQKEHDKYDQQYRTLDHDLTVAVQKGKDDIARMLIRKTKPLGNLCDELARQVATLDEEISQFKEHLSEQRLQYEQLKIRSAEFFHRTEMRVREKNLRNIMPESVAGQMSKEEIELELLKRKEALTPD